VRRATLLVMPSMVAAAEAANARADRVTSIPGLCDSERKRSSPGVRYALLAVRAALGPAEDWEVDRRVPFHSSRKWSAASFSGRGTWVLGAPEMIPGADPGGLRERATAAAATGLRVLALARGTAPLTDNSLPGDLRLVALVELSEELRPDAPATLRYFADQGVTVRIISGDSTATVAAVASAVDLEGAQRTVDARTVTDDAAMGEAVEQNRVFGRVTPEQKRQIVIALHDRSHVVAVTGDGVNDVLALKEADLGIAMGSGTPVARGVAQLVLLENQFEVLPEIVAEGRRVLSNIERVASLFVVKNVYSLIISIVVPIAGWPYPFLPRHLTLISAIAIGIPGFFLALAPDDKRFESGFLRRVLTFSIPSGAICALAILLTFAVARAENTPLDNAKTAAVTVTMIVSLWVLVIVARPLKPWKVGLVLATATLFAVAYLTPGLDRLLSLSHKPGIDVTLSALAFAAAAAATIDGITRRVARRTARHSPSALAVANSLGSTQEADPSAPPVLPVPEL
jgi:cation-transporting P-type ATPase E